jgi:hypothetical protein
MVLDSTHLLDATVLGTLRRLGNLQVLEVLCGGYHSGSYSTTYPGLPVFLEALPSANAIRQIKFNIQFEGWRRSSFAAGKPFWDRIDQILCNRAAFPDLDGLEFCITLEHQTSPKPPSQLYAKEEQEYWRESKMAGIAVSFSYSWEVEEYDSDY